MPKPTRRKIDPHAPKIWLRYCPKPEQADVAIDELLGLHKAGHIHGVMKFVMGSEEVSVGLQTPDEVRAWCEGVRPVRRALEENGVPWCYNVYQTIGFSRFAPGLRRAVPYQQMVGHDGMVVQEWACPLDPKFVADVAEMYAVLAAENPQTLWIDDDFRYFGRNPAANVCFCPLHVKEMERRTGQSFTRESLVKAIGDPYADGGRIREAWLRTLYESLAHIVDRIRERTSQVNPKTTLCLMTGGPEFRAIEGWDWNDLLRTRMAPKGPVIIRPGMGHYMGGDMRPYIMNINMARHQQTSAAGRGAECWPEIDNYPGGHFARSTRSMAIHMLTCAFNGMGPDQTMCLTSTMGIPLADAMPIFDELQDIHPMLRELNRASTEFRSEVGLRLLEDPTVGQHLDWTSDNVWEKSLQRPMDWTLPLLGFGTSFRPTGKPVSVGTGAALAHALGPERIAELMRNGLYVDGGFAQAMSRMQGLPITPQVDGYTAATFEETCDGAFGDKGDRTSLRYATRIWKLNGESPGARIVSVCRNHASEIVCPGHVIYDAGRAGRLAVTAYDGQNLTDQWAVFRSLARKRQLRAIFNWLGDVPLFANDVPDVVPLARRKGDAWLIAMANMRDDPWKRVAFDLAGCKRAPRRAELLQMNGKWKAVKLKTESLGGGKVRANLPTVPFALPLAVWRLV